MYLIYHSILHHLFISSFYLFCPIPLYPIIFITVPYNPTLPVHILSILTLLYFALPYFTISYLTLVHLTIPYLTLLYLTLPYLTLPYLNLPYVIFPSLTLPYLTLVYLPFLILHPHLISLPLSNHTPLSSLIS